MKEMIIDGEYPIEVTVPEDGDSPLQVLEYARVISFETLDDKFLLVEECDRYFKVLLTKDEMLKLAYEIRTLARKK